MMAVEHRREVRMYKVFKVEGGYEIYWCPSAPVHYNDKIPYDGKVYSTNSAAYRRVKQLNDALKEKQTGEGGRDLKEVA
jgi:hypothetical protein